MNKLKDAQLYEFEILEKSSDKQSLVDEYYQLVEKIENLKKVSVI